MEGRWVVLYVYWQQHTAAFYRSQIGVLRVWAWGQVHFYTLHQVILCSLHAIQALLSASDTCLPLPRRSFQPPHTFSWTMEWMASLECLSHLVLALQRTDVEWAQLTQACQPWPSSSPRSPTSGKEMSAQPWLYTALGVTGGDPNSKFPGSHVSEQGFEQRIHG